MSKSRDDKVVLHAAEDVEVRAPIIRKVLDPPQLQEIKEVKNVSVVHKDVVQEIHEQPIIEIAKKPEIVHVHEQPFVQKITEATKFEEIKEGFGAPELNIKQGPVHHVEEIGDVRHVNLGEDIKAVSRQEFIERHIVPTVTEIREQKVINVIEQPIVRKITEKPIIREITVDSTLPLVKESITVQSQPSWNESELSLQSKPILSESKFKQVEMRDSSLERANQLPLVQESTHKLVGSGLVKPELQQGVFSDEKFTEELSRGKTLLHSALPFATESFKEEIKWGQDVLHSARPFGQEAFLGELQWGKSHLRKSRYFSKDVFLPEFMAQKKLLKPVENNMYSEELSKLGNWKSDYFGKNLVESATGMFWNALDKVSQTYENVKEKLHHTEQQ